MSNEDNSPDNANPAANPGAEPSTIEHRPAEAPKRSRGGMMIGGSALAGMLLLGAVAGAVAMKYTGDQERMALLPPVAINAMSDGNIVAVKGKVVEQFGTKFIIADATGRALIDTGPEGDRAKVAQDEEVTVQGRLDDGFVRAGMVIHADGKVDELRPPRPHGPHHHRKGPPAGPDRPDGPPRGGPAGGPEGGPEGGPDGPGRPGGPEGEAL